MNVLRPYAELLRGRPWLVAQTTVLSLLQSLLLLPVALLVKRIFEAAVPNHHGTSIVGAALLILLLYVSSGMAGLANRYLVTRTVKEVVADLRERLISRLYDLSSSQLDRSDASDLHALVVQDSERLDQAAGQALAVIVPNAVVTLGLAVVSVALDVKLAAVLFVSVPALTIVARLLGRPVKRFVQRFREDFDAFSGDVSDAIRRLAVTRAFGTAGHDTSEGTRAARRVQDSGTQMAVRVGSWNIVNGLVAAGAGVAVLLVGTQEVIDGDLTLAGLLSFYAVSLLTLRSFGALLGAIPQLATGAPSLQRIQEFLAEPDEPPYTGTRQIDFRGGLELRQVRFGYDGTELLHGVDLRIEPGERLAIIGPNGAGKSTLARLVLGLYRPDAGELLADGVPYDEVDLASLRARTGVLFQDQVLHRGSIADVIRAGRDIAPEDVAQAAADAGAIEFIRELPDGFDTVAGEAAKLLSGGQRQRLALARALVLRPALLVLDEPTTHLDDDGIAQLADCIESLPQRPTVLMVTHDLALARRADRVVTVRDGKLAVGLPS